MKYKLIALDLDGTLVEEGSSWVPMHRNFGMTPDEDFKYYKMYHDGKIDAEEWIGIIEKIWKERGNPTKKRFEEILKDYKLVDGVPETIAELKKRGVKTAIVTWAIPLLAEIVAERLDVDYLYANTELIFDDNGNLERIKAKHEFRTSKPLYLEMICKKENITPQEVIAVGDNIEDVRLFEKAGFAIAFRPKHPSVGKAADVVIHDFKDILKYVE